MAYDLITNTYKQDLPLSGVKFSKVLNGYGSLSAKIKLSDPNLTPAADVLNGTEPVRTALYVDRGGVLVWGGVIWIANYDGDKEEITLNAEDFFSYFGQRFISNDLPSGGATYNTDRISIARALLTYAQSKPGGNIGVIIGSETGGATITQGYAGTEYKPIAEAIGELSKAADGFDFEGIEVQYDSNKIPRRYFRPNYPRRGRKATDSGLVLELPGAIQRYQWPWDGKRTGVTIYGVGNGGGTNTLRSTATDSTMIDNGYPLVEIVRSYKDVTVQSTLDALTQSDRTVLSRPAYLPTVTIRSDDDSILGAITGDEPTVKITDKRFPRPAAGGPGFVGAFRIGRIEVEVKDSGTEYISLTFGVALP